MNNNVNIGQPLCHRAWHIALCALLSTMILACTGSEKSQYSSINSEGWRYGDTLMLQPTLYQAADSQSQSGDLSIVVRHTNSYEYSNIWLRIDHTDGDSTVTDTVNVILADDYGSWLGKGLGMSFQLSQSVLYDINVDLSKPIKVSHIMRVDTLMGIEQVGVVFMPKSDRPTIKPN